MKYTKQDFLTPHKLRLNLKCSMQEKKFLLLEEDKTIRHQMLSSLIAANNNSRRGLKPVFKVVSVNYPSVELISQINEINGQVIEARNYSTNLFYSSVANREVEFIKDPKASSFTDLLKDFKLEAQLFYPHKVYAKLLPFVDNMNPEQKQRFEIFPEVVKMSFFPKQILVRFFASQLGEAWNVTLSSMLDKYLDSDTSPTLEAFIWFLMENKHENLAVMLSEIANSPLKETFFNLKNQHEAGHTLFVANHPDPVVNQFLLSAFIQECKGEFIANGCDNYFFMDERFQETNSLLYEQLSRIFPRADHHHLTVLFSSSFIPSENTCFNTDKSLLDNELAYLMDGLIVGKISDYTLLSETPFPEAVSNENKRSLSNREKLLIYLREGTILRPL